MWNCNLTYSNHCLYFKCSINHAHFSNSVQNCNQKICYVLPLSCSLFIGCPKFVLTFDKKSFTLDLMSNDDLMSNNPPDSLINPPTIKPKEEAYAILRSRGLTNSDVSQMLDITRGRGSQIDKKLNRRYDLTSPSNIKLAARAHKKLMNGFLDPDNNKLPIDLKGSDVNRCIDRVYDRAQPVNNQASGSVNLSFTQINIEEYK